MLTHVLLCVRPAVRAEHHHMHCCRCTCALPSPPMGPCVLGRYALCAQPPPGPCVLGRYALCGRWFLVLMQRSSSAAGRHSLGLAGDWRGVRARGEPKATLQCPRS